MTSKKRTVEAMHIIALTGHVDRLIIRKDDTFEMRLGFFYRHSGTSEKMAQRLEKITDAVKVESHWEHWATWPKGSYWVVISSIVDADALVKQVEALCVKHGYDWNEVVKEAKAHWRRNR